MVMSSFKTFLIIGVVLVILFGAVFYWFFGQFRDMFLRQAPTTATTTISESSLSNEQILRLQEQVGEIIASKDFSKCDNVSSPYYRTVCINNIALNLAQEKQDITYCQRLDDRLLSIYECEASIVFGKSLANEDIGVCAETKNDILRKRCEKNFWPSLALKKADINLCNNVQPEEKIVCRDRYIFEKEFANQPTDVIKKFNCLKFEDKQTRADCALYKGSDFKIGSNICARLRSPLFVNYCLLRGI